jgi:hypothetical protein
LLPGINGGRTVEWHIQKAASCEARQGARDNTFLELAHEPHRKKRGDRSRRALISSPDPLRICFNQQSVEFIASPGCHRCVSLHQRTFEYESTV